MPYLQPFYREIGPQSLTRQQQDDKRENLPSFLASILQAPQQLRAQASQNHTPANTKSDALPTGNRCGHNPNTPRLSLTRPSTTGPGGLPRILTLAQERAEEFFHSPRKYQRFFGVVDASGGLREGCSPSLKNPSSVTRGVASDYGVGEGNQYAAPQQGNSIDPRTNTTQINAETSQASAPVTHSLRGQGGSTPLRVQGSALAAGGNPPQKKKSSSSSLSLRLPRSERREALVLISKALFARLDLVSLCCGHRSPTGFSDISMRELMSLTGLSQRRCERAIALLKQAGFVEVSQPRERNSQGRYYGLRAIRVVTDFFFACLGLDRVLKKEKAKAQKRLESLGWHKARFGNWKKFFKGKSFGMGTNLPPAAKGKGYSPSPLESSPRQELSPCTRNELMEQPETWNALALNSGVGEGGELLLPTLHEACTGSVAQHPSLMGGAG